MSEREWIVRNDGFGTFLGNSFADVVGVVSGIGDDDFSRRAFEKRCGLRSIAFLPGGEHEPDRTSQSSHGQMNLGAQAAARASDGLILNPPCAPLACW